MANQIVVSAGAKVRNLNGVLTGTSGVVSSVPLGAANGVATLDSGGKVPVSQLPSSVVTYLGTWNAATNTPTLANGTGDAGDMYICNVAGTVNFGAGPVTFAVGDWVLYGSGTWQKSNGQNGTVTSVAVTESGDSLNITGSPISTSGTINIGFNGTNLQYVNGAGNLTTFPTLMTSVGLTMPSAFTVANSPLTGAGGTLAVTGAGYASQYIRGDGTLADFPSSGGGGSSVSYYLNGGTSQGTIGGTTYYEMSKTAVIGTGVDFTKTGDGFIVAFLTDANDPAQLNIPAGNWNYEIYASMSSNGGTPEMYAELYKYDGTTFTLISTSPHEILYDGTALNLYTFAMAVPATSLTLTDRLAIKLYATNSGGKTTTIHTQDGHLCQIITTFSTGITALNGLTAQVQYFQTGTSGTDFNISSTTATHTFNIPDASATARGLITTGTQTIAGTKTFSDATKNNGGIFLQNASSSSLAGYMNLGGLTNGVKFTSGGGISNTFTLPSATGYTFTFPNATGTVALTSDISYPVTSVFGRTGAVVATEGDYSLTQLSDVTITSPTTNQVLKYNGTAWINDTDANTGTVTSVGLSAPTGFSVTGSPVTSSGTLALAFASGYSLPTTVKQSNWDDAYTFVAAFPTQTGNSGKYLTTDGSVLSWATNPLGTVTSVGLSSATSGVTIGSSPITTSGTITLAIATASGSQNGLLSSSDFTTFNNKANALSGTINTIAYWDSATTINSLALATYPSLTEISYVKGVTSAIQTQLNAKQGTITLTTTGTSGAATFSANTLNIPNYGSALSGYLPLTGGTLTGALGGTSASFSSSVTATGLIINNNGEALRAYGASPNVSFYNSANTVRGGYVNHDGSNMNIVANVGGISFGGAATFSSSVTAGSIKAEQTTNANAVLTLNPNSGTLGTGYQWNLVGANSGSNYAFQIREASSTYLTITNSAGGTGGNVGIGTSSPSYKLDVVGSFNFTTGGNYLTYNSGILYHGNYYQYPSGNDYLLFARASGALILGSNDTERMRITSGGVVQVATTGSVEVGYSAIQGAYKLDVNGSTRLNGATQINGYEIINGVAGGTSTYLQFNNNGTVIGYAGSAAAITGGASTSIAFGNASGNGLSIASGAGAATFSSTLGIGGVADSVKSGTYTPTVTVISGGAYNITTYVARYTRVGNVVTVSGAFFYQPLGSGAVETNNEFTITLPITRTVTTNFASGTVSFSTVTGIGNQSQGYLYSTSTTVINLYSQNWYSGSGANAYYTFSYEIN